MKKKRVEPESVGGIPWVRVPDPVDNTLAQAQSDPSAIRIGGHTMKNWVGKSSKKHRERSIFPVSVWNAQASLCGFIYIERERERQRDKRGESIPM